MGMARKTTAQMVGEAFRELGTLLALFAPLERLLIQGRRLTPTFLLVVLVFIGSLMGFAIAIERKRKVED
jgi:hypothetical protein